MGLRDRLDRAGRRLEHNGGSTAELAAIPDAPSTLQTAVYQRVKQALHRKLIEQLDTARLTADELTAARTEIRALLRRLLEESNPPLNQEERQQLLQDLEHETLGLGPLEPLLADRSVDDVLVNRWDEVYVERAGQLQKTGLAFRDNLHLLQIIERIVSRVGRRIDESSPMVDARLPDGSRVNAIIPPLAVDGPVLSIRRVRQQPLTMEDLLRFGSVDGLIAALLEASVKARLNILISGGSGSGKTTLLNALIRFIGRGERVVSIEDTVELQMQGLHVVRLETRPPNVERQGEVTQRDLVKNALRMRPDRIVVGEVRGAEALDMLQAMNTGHKGSITTVHANSPRDALARLETMILMAGFNLTSEGMRRQISSGIDVIVQLNRFADGIRRVVSFYEIAGMEEQVIKLQEIARFQESVTGGAGRFIATGVMPVHFDELTRSGVVIPKIALPAKSSADRR